MLLLIVGILLVGMAVALAARAVALPRLRAVERRAEIGGYGFGTADAEAASESSEPEISVVDQLAERIGTAVLPRLKPAGQNELRELLASAGMYRTGPGRFLGYRVLSAIVLLIAWIWLAPVVDASPLAFVVGAVIVGANGWIIPLAILRRRAAQRFDRIDFEMPQLIDSLIVTIESGLGFGGALRMAARELRGPLAEEMSLTLQEQDMGLTTTSALRGLLERADTPSMRSFVRAVEQAESMGVPMGEILRSLAVEMRARRRAQAEQRAQKAPIKILFPLTFLIFPAIMIIIAYPGVKIFIEAIGG